MIFNKKQKWKQIISGKDWLSSYTDYVDFDGTIYRIYDLVIEPGFSSGFENKNI